ncbi:hypothetical protein CSC80_03570 [Maribacter sp. 6B07]|uniref:hypothetical protein n=1 Tax=Maribacter sp. 6B07 TaxID=2045442 RepID=UPI000C08AEF8|nr:hypothetical protein [Maribacter sp. 6B07]PHN94445.1 hypothetical protein CSC80_03570 [Maribacter sp. 6B07]
MSLRNDIERIVWHEMGHFVIDVHKPKHHPDYCVNEIVVEHNKRSDSYTSWSGYVKMLPTKKYALIPEDPSFMSYSLISLISGCIFETIYFADILNVAKEIDDCFSFKPSAMGSRDYNSYYNIITHSRSRYENFRGNKDVNAFLEFDFKDLVKNEISKNKDFILSIKNVIDSVVLRIEKDFLANNEPSPYDYRISEEALDELKAEVLEISGDKGFSELIVKLRDNFTEQYTGFIEKYNSENDD